jgi:hypothetical protein
MHADLMWVWWAATMGLCAWKLIEGFVRPQSMLEWPFLASAMWAYFYGYMGYDAKLYLHDYMPGNMAALGQLMALLCLIAVLAGWQTAMQAKAPPPLPPRPYRLYYIWAIGLFFMLVGAAGGYSVMRAAQSGALVYQDASAYWYLLFYVGYPGLAMALWALCRMEPGSRKYLLIFITVLFLAAFMFPHISTARRGPLFPAVIILLLVPPLARRKAPNPWVFFGGLAVAGVVMLLFLQIRHVTYSGGSWSEALQNVDVAAVADRGEEAEDNEYVNSSQVIGTIYQNGKYQYGSGHLSLLYHWVPRAIWKDKPVLGEGSYSFDQMFDDVESATGFHLLGSGASSGGVADTFVQYGILCPVFWFVLSWVFGRVYVRACIGGNPLWLFSYVGFICASHWLVSQSFSAAFVPGAFFQVVPLTVFLLLDQMSPAQRPVRPRRSATIRPGAQPAPIS